MDTNSLFQNGSVWLRADFHLHTKADKEFSYNGEDNDFVNLYVNKLVEQNIRVGIITNHNKFDAGEYKAIAKKARKEGIYILPGVELSVNDGANGVHALVAFDPSQWLADGDDFIGKHNYENENGRSNHSLKETLAQLDKLNKNFFVIMAYDESPKSIDEIGKGATCFLKIGDFNFEAVKFALIDSKDRCSKERNHKPANSYIKSIAFQGGLLDGKQISFSPELNNLIGIRGSGKSSILEIVRYALNIPFGSQAVDKDYKDELIKHVLKSGGKAIVEIVDRQGSLYKIERIYGQKEDIYKNGLLQQGITLDAILQQPIYFGQKDLSNKNADFENDLVNKLIGNRLNNVQTRIDKQKGQIKHIINELQTFGYLAQLKKETETAKANAEYRLGLFKEKGVAEKLQLQTSFESDFYRLQNFKAEIDLYLNDLQDIVQNHEHSLNKAFESKTNPEIFEKANFLADKLRMTLEQIKTIYSDVQKTGIEFTAVVHKLKVKKEELKEEFARIKREINIPELNPDDYIKINRELDTSKLKLIEIEKSENKRIELERLLNEDVNILDNLWHEKFTLLKDEVNKINEAGGKLLIEVNYKGRKDKFLSKLQEAFRGSRISEATYTAISNDYADFVDMRKDDFRKLSGRLTENQFIEVKNRFNANLYDLLSYNVPDQIIINFDGKPLEKHSLGQRASALILFLLSQKENDILIIDQPEDDLDNQTIYEDVIREIKRLKGQMQFIFATHNANIPVLGDSEMLVACQYVPDNEIKIESGSIDCQNIQDKIIRIMEGGQEAFDIRKKIYKIWEDGKR